MTQLTSISATSLLPLQLLVHLGQIPRIHLHDLGDRIVAVHAQAYTR